MKTAVVLFGFLRTYDIASYSLIKHILEPNNADLFIFAPNNKGCVDYLYHKNDNEDAKIGEQITSTDLQRAYGNYLKKFELYLYNELEIIKDINISEIQPIASISPVRIISMFYHINKSIELMEEYEKEMGIKYERVILTRGDLAFFSPIIWNNININNINIPIGMDFSRITGERKLGCAGVFYYKNVRQGIIIPGNTYSFNDQFLVSSRDNIVVLKNIYPNLKEMMVNKVPCNPETIFFYWLKCINNINIDICLDVLYEIFRPCMNEVENINNLDGFYNIKNLSPKEKFISNHPILYILWIKLLYKIFNKKKYKEEKLIYKNIRKSN